MKKGKGDESVESVKRLTATTPVVPSQIFVQPQHFTSVPLLPSAGTGSLVGTPTAVAISVQPQQVPIGGDQCLVGGTITYTQPNVHSAAPCNIVFASPQPYVTSVPVPPHIASGCNNCSDNLSPVAAAAVPVSHIPSTCNSSVNWNAPSCISNASFGSSVVANYSLVAPDGNHHQPYTGATELSQPEPYPSACSLKRSAQAINNVELTDGESGGEFAPKVLQEPNKESAVFSSKPATPYSPQDPRSQLPSVIKKRLQGYAVKRSKEPVKERQERLSQKFNLLIRSKILELVRARGAKKTVCPSEVARALSPKAWRDLMPKVRKIGIELVEEGLILVTQRGAIVDLATVRGPVRFGLAQEN